jgi:ABC-type transport system involved in cytochrome bd biosynthesis fused ATPase/permease subunit
LQTFLLYEENELYAKHPTPINGIKVASKAAAGPLDNVNSDNNVAKEMEMGIMNGNDDKYAIRMTNVYAKWSENAGEDSLSNLNIDVEKGRLLAIIGPVGAGKVSFRW